MRRIRDLAGPFFVFAGAMHFVIPKTYQQIVPPYVPAPEASPFGGRGATTDPGVK